MVEEEKSTQSFVSYEYQELTFPRAWGYMYYDNYENFGWELDATSNSTTGFNKITARFKRNRKIRNKAELTRLQRQFEGCTKEIERLEKSKTTKASVLAYVVGLLGTALMAGATFAFLGGNVALCILLALPAFLGWILPYFAFKSSVNKKTTQVTPLIDNKYDEVCSVCEKAYSLLNN